MESGVTGTGTEASAGANGVDGEVAVEELGCATRRRARRSRRSRSIPRRRSRHGGAGPRQPARLGGDGIEGRYHWLGKLRDWILDNQDHVLDTMQRETGKVRADATNEPAYLTDLINFYGSRAAGFIGEEAIRPHSPLLASKKLRVQYRPHPVVGSSAPGTSPWSSRSATRSRRCRPAPRVVIKPSEFTPLGLAEVVDAWKREIAPPTSSTSSRGSARPAARWSTRSTSSSSPAPTGPAAR